MSLLQLATLIVNTGPLPKADPDFKKIVNIILEIMGALAVLMVVIAGLRYITSGTNPDSVAAAKRMIIYSIIGLLVIALAASLVNFVLVKL